MDSAQQTVTVTTTDTMVLRTFFFAKDAKASTIAAELRALDGPSKAALASGIRDGSYTYA